MGQQPSSTQIFAKMEQEAYHACREWPLWLVIRRRQLEAALQLTKGGIDERNTTGSGRNTHAG